MIVSFQNRKGICSLLLTIRNFKHNSSHRPVTLELNKQSGGVCPIKLISKYFISRPENAGPLFVFPDGKPIPRSFFIAYLKKALSVAGIPTNKFHGHPFRIYSCTDPVNGPLEVGCFYKIHSHIHDCHIVIVKSSAQIIPS